MKLEKSLLTVIVPIYNVRKYLKRCLSSLIVINNQVNYILVDDGSTDGSDLIAKKWCDSYENIYYIRQKNGGLSSARNTGLKYTKSKWVYFADSDDYVTKGFINKMIEILKQAGTNEFFSLPVLKKMGNKEKILQNGIGKITRDDFILKLIRGERQFGVWSYIFNVKVLKDNNLIFEKGKLFEDQYFLPSYLKFVKNIQKVSNKQIGFYNYCVRKNSISNSNLNEQIISSKCTAELYRDHFLKEISKSKEVKDEVSQNQITVLFRAYIDSLKINDIGNASKYKERVAFLVSRNDLGRLTIKHYLKVIMLSMPQKLLVMLTKMLNR